MEPPECPVCLQFYDAVTTIPRVLACGHSSCESCLTQLPKPYSHATIRCPTCTQLVTWPYPQGPSALPKNIDLLRYSPDQLSSTHTNNCQKGPVEKELHQLLPRLWSDEFYSRWKNWIIPFDGVLFEGNTKAEDGSGICSVFLGRTASSMSSSSLLASSLKHNEHASLIRLACSSNVDESVLDFTYVAKIMQVLYELNEEWRVELDMVLKAGSRLYRACRPHGLWYNLDDRWIYLVCERIDNSLSDILGDDGGIFAYETVGLAMVGLEICETVISLHSEGLLIGCFSPSCCVSDRFGHICLDLNEVLITGRKACKSIADGNASETDISMVYASILENNVFLSPELFLKLMINEGFVLECGFSDYSAGCASDSWPLACVLLRILIGQSFVDELRNNIDNLLPTNRNENENVKGHSYLYLDWLEKMKYYLESKLSRTSPELPQILCKCLDAVQTNRPCVTDVWRSIRKLMIKAQSDVMVGLERELEAGSSGRYLVLGELCHFPRKSIKRSQTLEVDDYGEQNGSQGGDVGVNKDLVEGASSGNIKFTRMDGHLDCVTGLAVGGGFLFSSSIDKTIKVWSLQDFTCVHTFRGHQHKVMALVFLDGEQPYCISGDIEGGIFMWGTSNPLRQEPIKKWYQEKDWRHSGIYSMALSASGYLYTGCGDHSIKAWWLQDCTLSCTMNAHKSVVSTLVVCEGVLYSGSWDGTIRLWSLSDHNTLAVLEDDINRISISSIFCDNHTLVVAYENGSIKIWSNDVLKRYIEAHNSAIFALCLEGKWLFSGGWDKTIKIQKLSWDGLQLDVRPIGSIACESAITALSHWQGNVFCGCADKSITVYYFGE